MCDLHGATALRSLSVRQRTPALQGSLRPYESRSRARTRPPCPTGANSSHSLPLPLLRLSILLCCTDCHSRVLNEDRPSCPVCRVRLSRQRPSRNRFAEGVKSRLLVPCTQAGCSELVLFEHLNQHLSTQCGYRSAVCMFQPLGCGWSGLEINHEQHEKKCKIRGFSAKELLPLVRRRNEEYESQIQAAKRTASVQNHVSRHTGTDRTTGKSTAQLWADVTGLALCACAVLVVSHAVEALPRSVRARPGD